MNFTGILLELHHDQRGRALGRNLVRLAKEVGIVVFQAAREVGIVVFQAASLVFVVCLVMWVLAFVDCTLLSTHHGDGKSRRSVMLDVKNVVRAIEQFQLQKDRCPRDIDELKTAGVVSRVQRDPWGRPFVIECSETKLRVCSRGADEVDHEDDVCHEELPYQSTPWPLPPAGP